MRLAGKILVWLVAIIVVLIAAIVIFIVTFDWNRARPWVDDKVSQAIGRQFSIDGDLRVGWRRPPGETGWRGWVLWPHFSATNIVLANPDWAKQPSMAKLDEIDFDVAVLPLLTHRIVIPSINLVNPSVDLERMLDGRNNWTFKLPASTGPSEWSLDLRDIAFAKGQVGYADQQNKVDVKVVIDTLGQPVPFGDAMKQQEAAARQDSTRVVGRAASGKLAAQVSAVAASEARAAASASAASAASVANSASGAAASTAQASASTVASGATPGGAKPVQQGYAIGWTLQGTYKGTKVSGNGKLGGVLALQDASRPYPLQADVRVGDTRIAVVGTLTDPAHLAALDVRLWLSGVSMAHLYAVTGVTLPDTPPYATEGRLIGHFKRGGNVFTYENFTGRVGGSDLNGSLTYAAKLPRPLLSGALVSNLLQFADLAPIIGADSNASKAKRGDAPNQPANKALPVAQFHTDRWKAIDADVKFTGRRIIRQASLPVTDLYTHVIMQNGVLALDPLNFGVAGGTLVSNIHLDGAQVPLRGRFGVIARHLKLKQLFPTFAPMKSSFGEINGDATLSAVGNSPAALAGSSNGEIKLLMNDGAISQTLLEEAGLNVANIVVAKLFGDKDVKINCAATDFVVTNGLLDSRIFALDTQDAVINVDGKINLQNENMDLSVHPHTKGFRILSLRSPLYVRGTFKNPKVGVEVGALVLRGGAAIGLGLIAPFAALIPLIAPSNTHDSSCAQLVAEMKKAPTAPPPGQRQKARAPFAASTVPNTSAKRQAAPVPQAVGSPFNGQ